MERTYGIGIDLGTSFSAITRVDISTGRYEFAEAKEHGGQREIPSVVFVDTDGALEFGHVAAVRQNSIEEAARVIPNFKLLLRSNQPITVPGVAEPVEPVRLVREFLIYLKSCFESTLKVPCPRAVVTVPAYQSFDVDYKARVREAAMLPEPLFESISTVEEPDAVLLSMGDLSQYYGKTVLVFDMGGGTLDVSVRDVDERDGRPFLTHRAVDGSDAAGRRVTDALSDRVLDAWERKHGFTFTDEERSTARRINHVPIDEAKRHLSGLAAQHGPDSERSFNCKVHFVGKETSTFTTAISVREFTALSRTVCEEALATVEKTLASAGMTPSDVDAYFMVGGSSRLPLMESMLRELFGRAPEPLQGPVGTIDSTLAVCRGAAIEDLERDEDINVPSTRPVLERKLPYAVSLLVDGRRATRCLVPADSPLPFGPVSETFYVHADGDESVGIELVRGSGDPADCVPIAPHTVYFARPQKMGKPFEISWYIDESGELTVTAFDSDNNELGVIRAASLMED